MATPMDIDRSSGLKNHTLHETPSQVGKRKAREFLEELAKETPSKSRRLTIVVEIAAKEREREKVHARLRKNKERSADLMAKIEADSIEKARLDTKIQSLKRESLELE